MFLKYQAMPLALKHVFRVAASSKSIAHNFRVELHHDGLTGLGEAAPSRFYQEDANTVPIALEKIGAGLDLDPFLTQSRHAEIASRLAGNYAAKAAVDMAFYDWIGKRLNLPVWKYLGIDVHQRPLVTSYTIGIDTLERLPEKIAEASAYPILKIKLGTEYDFQIIEMIRSLTNKPIWVDANEGWQPAEAQEKINWLATQNVELVEQPLLAADIAGARWLRERVSLPLIADESVKTSQDLLPIHTAFDGINIKLMKCGGITEALRMIHGARAFGLKIMLGCFIESALGITAAAQLAPCCDYLDLDGALLLQDQPFEGVQFECGVLKFPNGPGLGVVPT
ncbi:dipeptide epimerase [candidate division KSB1 bacterium]|nr:dipeptide epimerase [candidate division KSB1 bacterium]